MNKRKKKKIEDAIESIIDENNLFNTFDDFWWEDDLFNKRNLQETIDASQNILEEINEMSDNIFRNIRPIDTRTEQEII